MIIEDICTVKLDKKSKKFICDLLINDYVSLGAKRSSIRELHNTLVSDLEDDMLSKYLTVLNFDQEAQKSFINDYKELETLFKTEGCRGVLHSTDTLRNLCINHYKNEKRLFGEQLESAVNIQVDNMADNFSLAAWDTDDYGSAIGLLKRNVATWSDRARITESVNLGADISNVINTVNRDGVSESLIDEVMTITTNTGYNDMLDSELYVRLISSIKKGTKLLFPLSSSSKIRGEIYNILNYYYEMEYKMYCKRMTDMKVSKLFNVNDVIPHKLKKDTPLNEGHLVVVDPSYAYSGIGHEDTCNKTVEQGKHVLKSYIEAIEYVKGKLSPNETPVACFMAMDVINTIESKNPDYKNALDFMSVVIIIDAIICAEHLISILEDNGLSILRLPIIEIRENTWSRFSCIYELVNFYRTHPRLEDLNNLNLTHRDYAQLNTEPVNILDIINRQQTVESSSYESYLETNFSKLKIDNRCNISNLRKDENKLNFAQSDSLSKVTYIYIQTLYLAGKSLEQYVRPIIADDEFMFAMDLFSAIYVPLLAKASTDFACCDFYQPQLLDLVSIGNGQVLCNLIDEEIECLESLFDKSEYNNRLGELEELILSLNSIKNKKDYKGYYRFLEELDVRLYGYIEQHKHLSVYFDDNSRLSKGIYLIFCNVMLSEFLFGELSEVVSILLNDNDIDIIGGNAEDDFNRALDRCGNNMLKLLLNVTKYENCKVFYNTDIDVIFNEFVNYLSKKLGLKILSKARLKDFAMYDIFECNSSVIHNMNLIIHEFIKCIEQKLMSKLSKNLDRGVQESYWSSIKDKISRDFIAYSRDDLSDAIYNHSYSSGLDIVESLSSIPTLKNSTIIGLTEPFKQHLRDGGDYYVFSSLGYKMLLKSRLGEVETMTEEDVNLVLSNTEWR